MCWHAKLRGLNQEVEDHVGVRGSPYFPLIVCLHEAELQQRDLLSASAFASSTLSTREEVVCTAPPLL